MQDDATAYRDLRRLAQVVRSQGLLQPQEQAPPSPCVRVCTMGEAGPGAVAYCQGCLRSLDEIARWGQASAAEKRAIWLRLLQRADIL